MVPADNVTMAATKPVTHHNVQFPTVMAPVGIIELANHITPHTKCSHGQTLETFEDWVIVQLVLKNSIKILDHL